MDTMTEQPLSEPLTTADSVQEEGSKYFEGDFFDYLGSDNDNTEIERDVSETHAENQDGNQDTQNAQKTSINEPERTLSFDEYFQTPEEFETHEEALGWYQERMSTLREELMNPDNPLTREYIDNYVANRLEEEDQVIGGFKEAYEALLKNPKEYLIQFVPEILQEYGIEPILSTEQMDLMVDKQLKGEFGEDYRGRWNSNELLDLNSFTSKLLARRNEIVNQLESVNNKNKELLGNWNRNIAQGQSNINQLQSMSKEESFKTIKEQYGIDFINKYKMPEESFDQFLEEVSDRELTLEDLHRVQYFEGYMKQAYEKGLNDAKSGLYKKLNQEQNAKKPMETSKSTPKIKGNTFLDSVLNGKMHIPNY
jgi:hypothetical protein